jgi:ABC-type amino acid transport substrate-binding protein
MQNKLKVAVADFSPLIMSKDGKYSGFEIDLWETIAKEIGVDFEYEKYNFKEIIPLLIEKKVDVGISGISITEDREKNIDFSHETLDSGLLISVNRDRNKPKFFETLGTVFSEGRRLIGSAFLGVLVFVIIFGNLLWLAERSADTFSKSYFPGIFESFWLTVVSMSTVGFGDYLPHTWLGRIIVTGIVFGGAIIFGLLVAQVAAFLAIRKVRGKINNSRDLSEKVVATIKGSTSEDALERLNAKIVRVNTAEKAYQKLKKGLVDAVVFDAPSVIYHEKKDKEKQIEIVGELFDKQKYGIALCQGSPLRENINRAVLKIIESGQYDSFYKKWFGEDLTMEV